MTEHMDNQPTPNIPLLRKAVEWVEVEAEKPMPEREWAQGTWISQRSAALQEEGWCGTACCVAGYIGVTSDAVEMVTDRGYFTGEVKYPDGLKVHVAAYAAAALGLTMVEADRLFAGSNTASEIRDIAEEIAGERL